MMDVLGNEIDPYKTWDPTEATDDADGLPDVGMVSLITGNGGGNQNGPMLP